MARRKVRTFGVEIELPFQPQSVVEVLHDAFKKVKTPLRSTFLPNCDDYWAYEHGCLNSWVLKRECRIVEINTPPTARASSLRKTLEAIREAVKGKRTIRASAGTHVHIDVNDFSQKKLVQLVCEMARLEDFFFILQPKHRSTNDFCRPLKEIFRSFIVEDIKEGIGYFLEAKNIERDSSRGVRTLKQLKEKACHVLDFTFWTKPVRDRIRGYNTQGALGIFENCLIDKAEALSFQALDDLGTVEFRLGNWSDSPDDNIHWPQLLRAFVNEIKKRKSPIPRPRCMSDFLKKIHAPEETKRWAMSRFRKRDRDFNPTFDIMDEDALIELEN